MLGEDLERAIVEAWLRVRDEILADPDELRRRLARRRMKSLTRPPRAWCIALRASDRRINLANAMITPEHAISKYSLEHPYEVIEHEVVLVKRTLQRLCRPKQIAWPGQDVKEVAQMLGVLPQGLRTARHRAAYRERYCKGLGGKWGRPVPVIHRRELLDPSMARLHSRPHPVWGSNWEFLPDMMSDDFEQAVKRRPVYRPFGRGGGAEAREGQVYKEECQFLGWRWVCPGCAKEVRTIYYPVAARTLFHSWFKDPVKQLELSDADLMGEAAGTFACYKCHGVRFFSSIEAGCWNEVIGRLSGGLLYGCEVEKPADFPEERKNRRARQLDRAAPVQRKVLMRLRNGWSNFQIARDLGMTKEAVKHHVLRICRQEEVSDRHALAEKLKFAVSPPLNQEERAGVRRAAVKELMMRGLSYREMMEKLSIDRGTVNRDVCAIYKVYGVSGSGSRARRALAEKLGVSYETKWDELRRRVGELRERGLKGKEIAEEMGISFARVRHFAEMLRKERKQESEEKAVGQRVAALVIRD
jgi:DNA-binding NarL/FixJ family response regulator